MANAGTYNHTKQHFAEGAAAATPDAAEVVLYAKSDGKLYSKDDAGAETLVSGGTGGGGDITSDAAWAAKGDLIAATANNAAAVVSVGTNGSSVRAASGATSGIEWQKNNLAASVAPAVTDDIDLGYTVGSRWADTTADKEYVCLDNADGAAVWKETTPRSYVGCKAFNSAAQSVNGTAALTLDGEEYDTATMHSTSSNTSRITVSATGYWRLTGHSQVASMTGGAPQWAAWFRVDGTTTVVGSGEGANIAGDPDLPQVLVNMAATVYLTSGQYVELMAYSNAAIDFGHANADLKTTFTAEYLGA